MAEKPIERIGSTSDIIPVAVNVTKKTSEETNSDATISLEDNQFIDNETGGVEVDSKKKKGSDVSKKNKKRKSEVVIKLPKKPKRDPVVSEIVWAKISSYPWWPAQVLEPSEQHIKIRHKKTDHFVVFFGDGNCSWLDKSKIDPWTENYESRIANKNKGLQKALLLAFKAISES